MWIAQKIFTLILLIISLCISSFSFAYDLKSMFTPKETFEVTLENGTITIEPLKNFLFDYSTATKKDYFYVSQKELLIIPGKTIKNIIFTTHETAKLYFLFDLKTGGFWDKLIAKNIYDPMVFTLYNKIDFGRILKCNQQDKFFSCNVDGETFYSFMFQEAEKIQPNQNVVCLLISVPYGSQKMLCISKN